MSDAQHRGNRVDGEDQICHFHGNDCQQKRRTPSFAQPSLNERWRPRLLLAEEAEGGVKQQCAEDVFDGREAF